MCRLKGVGYVHIVRPGFCPVFPRVRGRIGTHEIILPVWRRPFCIVTSQGLAVVGTFITKHASEFFEPRSVADEQIPVIMSDFMTTMPE